MVRPASHGEGLMGRVARETDGFSRLPHRREREPRNPARLPGHREGLTGLSAGEPGRPAGEPDDRSRDARRPESERGGRSGEPDELAGGHGGVVLRSGRGVYSINRC